MKEAFVSNLDLIILLGGFIMIAIAAHRIAAEFKKIKLPLITGLIIAGLLAGPYIMKLMPIEAKDKLNFINEISLAFIAFAAGAELYLRELRSRFKSIKWNTFGQLFVSFFLGSLIVYFLAEYIPYMKGQSSAVKFSIAILTGTVFVARSPASAIAVVNELRAKGPFTSTVMGVTVLKDFLVIILFAINFSIAETLINGDEINIVGILLIFVELLLSVGAGFLYGLIIRMVFKINGNALTKTVLIIAIGYTSYLLHHFMRDVSMDLVHHKIVVEPLLVCIIASFYVTNYTKHRPEFLKILEEAGPHIYIAFFTFTGISMSLDTLVQVWSIALILFFVRLLTMVIGAYIGGTLAGDPMKYNHVGWMPYLTQAGVALGLSTAIANEFADWGVLFSTSIIAMIVINQFIGPPLFKYALMKLGEDGTRATNEFDGIDDAIIFGYENQSVALAKQLQTKGWLAKIATIQTKGSFEEPEGVDIHYLQEFSKEEFDRMEMDKTEVIVTFMSDRENLKICELAYENYGTDNIVVRLNERYNYDKFLKLGAKIVDPSTAMVGLMDHFVRSPHATSLLLGMETGQDTRDIQVLNPDLKGLTLRDLRLPNDVIILSIKRGGQMIISHGYTRLRLGDIVTFVGSNDSLEDLTLRFEG